MDKRPSGEEVPLAVVVKSIVQLASEDVQVKCGNENLALIRVE